MSRIDEALRRSNRQAVGAATPELAPTVDTWADGELSELVEEGAFVPIAVAGVVRTDADVDDDFGDELPELSTEEPVARAGAVPPARAALPTAAAAVKVAAAQAAPIGDMIQSTVLGGSPEMLVTGTARQDAVEQYRKLAATLHHVQANRGVRVLLCTSAVMGEGKTITSANLALTLSHSYQRRVLLIDADLRRPRIHTVFNVPNKEGLFEALDARNDRKVAVTPVSPWLSVVTAGRPGPDPVHVLTSERLSRVLEDAGSNFDWVIIDTPPVLVLPDAGLLMGMVDAAILVIGAGQTTYRMARRAVEALGRDRIVGVVMNRVDDAELQEGYGGYYGYYQSSDTAKQA